MPETVETNDPEISAEVQSNPRRTDAIPSGSIESNLKERKAIQFRAVIMMPVFQDWECAALVCKSLDEQLKNIIGVEIRILLVDDGSTDDSASWSLSELANVVQIDVLRLARNLGHQRAICTGLCYIHDHVPCDAVVVMDSDGEDQPEDAIKLIELAMSNRTRVLFAKRRKRQEGVVFRAGYVLFRGGHRLLTGIPVRVGNFSVVPFPVVRRLVCMSELWNHFAGAVFRSKARFECIPMDRGRRLLGRSHMNLVSLVAHGISGIATFHESVATRILISNVVCLLILIVALLGIVGIKLLTNLAIAGWATYTTGFVLVLAIQLSAMWFSLVFTLISSRSAMTFVPKRDYVLFVDKFESLSRLG